MDEKKIINPTPQEVKEILEDVKIQEAAKKAAEELKNNEAQAERFNAFISDTRERFDRHFDNLGYACFVFDKNNMDNKFVSVISNVSTGWYLNKLKPFIAKHRQNLNKLKNHLDVKLRRV